MHHRQNQDFFFMDKSERQSLFPSQAIIKQVVTHPSVFIVSHKSPVVFGDPLQFLFSWGEQEFRERQRMAETKTVHSPLVTYASVLSLLTLCPPFVILLWALFLCFWNMTILGFFTLFFFFFGYRLLFGKESTIDILNEATIFLNFIRGVLDLNKPLDYCLSKFDLF
jgi:hypothetical protein